MTAIQMTVTGDAALDAVFRQLEKREATKAAKKGTRAGAKVVKDRAESLVPVDEGTLQETLAVRVARGTGKGKFRRGEFGHMVTHRDTGVEDPFYAPFVEFGTKYTEPDRYLRESLYESANEVLAANRQALAAAIRAVAGKRS